MFLDELDCCWSSNFKIRWNPSLSSLDLSLAESGRGTVGVGGSCGLGSALGPKNPVNFEARTAVFAMSSPCVPESFFLAAKLPKKASKVESTTNGVSTFFAAVPEKVRS